MGDNERRAPPLSEKDQVAFWRGRVESAIKDTGALLGSEVSLTAWASASATLFPVVNGILIKYGKEYLTDEKDEHFIPYREIIVKTTLGDQMKIYAVLAADLHTVESWTWSVKDMANPQKPEVTTLCFPSFTRWQEVRKLFPEFSLTIFDKGFPKHFAFTTDEERELSEKEFINKYLIILRVLYDFLRDKEEALARS